MYTKRIANIIIVSFLVVTASFAVGFYFSQPQTIALANNEPLQQISTELPVETILSQDFPPIALSKTNNDIKVDVTSARIISTGIEIGICYTTPDNGEWRPMPGHLYYGTSDILPDEIEFLSGEKMADGKDTGIQCAYVRYLVEDLKAITTPVEFSILRFYAPGREMYSPCQELQERLKTNPKAQAYGLKAKCDELNDGNISVTLADYDRSVEKVKADILLKEIAKGEVDGPWEFTITEIEK